MGFLEFLQLLTKLLLILGHLPLDLLGHLGVKFLYGGRIGDRISRSLIDPTRSQEKPSDDVAGSAHG